MSGADRRLPQRCRTANRGRLSWCVRSDGLDAVSIFAQRGVRATESRHVLSIPPGPASVRSTAVMCELDKLILLLDSAVTGLRPCTQGSACVRAQIAKLSVPSAVLVLFERQCAAIELLSFARGAGPVADRGPVVERWGDVLVVRGEHLECLTQKEPRRFGVAERVEDGG